jgi:hypothetical protein
MESAASLRMRSAVAAVCFGVLTFAGTAHAPAQGKLPRFALKSGESAELRNYFWVVNCQSILVGNPTAEILEGPEEVEVAVKPDKILPRAQNCAKEVPGGHIIATAKDIKERKDAKLTIRLKFNTKQGERQSSDTYIISLFP